MVVEIRAFASEVQQLRSVVQSLEERLTRAMRIMDGNGNPPIVVLMERIDQRMRRLWRAQRRVEGDLKQVRKDTARTRADRAKVLASLIAAGSAVVVALIAGAVAIFKR